VVAGKADHAALDTGPGVHHGFLAAAEAVAQIPLDHRVRSQLESPRFNQYVAAHGPVEHDGSAHHPEQTANPAFHTNGPARQIRVAADPGPPVHHNRPSSQGHVALHGRAQQHMRARRTYAPRRGAGQDMGATRRQQVAARRASETDLAAHGHHVPAHRVPDHHFPMDGHQIASAEHSHSFVQGAGGTAREDNATAGGQDGQGQHPATAGSAR
jgi:hypothetical protein